MNKKGAGRPKIDKPRKIIVQVRFTQEEHDLLKLAAHNLDYRSLSDFIRLTIFAAANIIYERALENEKKS